jgi:succinate dehydrogenase / fumarate reductase iron-sulfur subunit
MNIVVKIERYNPEKDAEPFFQEFSVEVEPSERLLDALIKIKSFEDGSLGFRKSCAHGVCGSDAMRINGKDGLACKTLIKDVVENDGDTVTVEPLRHLPVQRDLIVDQEQFFAKYRSVEPFLKNDEQVEHGERLQSPQERLVFDDATNCILCASCYSACPVLDSKPGFIGPAASAQAFRFIADSRDSATNERLEMLHTSDGVWACDNHFACTKCCPRSILITKRINETKQMIKKLKKVTK